MPRKYTSDDAGREARRATVRRYYSKNRERIAAYRKLYANGKRSQKWRLRREYGLTPEAFAWMLEQQGGACRLCPADATVVDHDHADGQLRGLLCVPCNTALGKLGDTSAGLLRAHQYLSSSEPV